VSDRPVLKIKRLAPARDGDLPLPVYMTEGAAGMDVVAAVEAPLVLAPGEWARVPTGLAVAVPRGYELQVRARSGLAMRHGVGVLNGPGTVDSDYRGEVGVLLMNWGREHFTIERGMRIAQWVIAPVIQVEVTEVVALDVTDRGDGGFGHTGV
jgi:dUTP pyrophosphatase